MDPVGLLHRVTGFDWKIRRERMPLLPADLGYLEESMRAALGKATARDWARDYVAALENGRYKPHHRFSLEDAQALRDTLAR